MAKKVTVKEAKAMLGTEFDYRFSCGDTIRAFVKAFDPKVGFSCFTIEGTTKNGYELHEENAEGECVIGIKIKNKDDLNEALDRLTEIRDDGVTGPPQPQDGIFPPVCSFEG